ncbi:MAG: hypothetical protein KME03_13205 [Aphanocapsa lilacina HA4352-LM1]|jgi:hypothetical protein|nr:hypothetical protein [Aphanocapsa lilacina HA4352-LM1]
MALTGKSLSIGLAFWLGCATIMASPARALPELPSADLTGGAVSAEKLRGKVSVVILANQASDQEATDVSREIVIAMNPTPERYAFALILDLQSIPDFARGLTMPIIESRLEQSNRDIIERLQKTGQTFQPPLRLGLPDWSGEATRAWLQSIPDPDYAIFREQSAGLSRFKREKLQRDQQRLKSQVQVFVLDPALNIKAHFSGRLAGARAIEAMRTLAG